MPETAGVRSQGSRHTYRYRAVAADGSALVGSVVAADRGAAARELRQKGLVPTFVSGAGAGARGWAALHRAGRRASTLRFTEDLCTLLSAGVSLEKALATCSASRESAPEAAVAGQVLAGLREGKTLATALSGSAGRFSGMYIAMVRAAEATGSLPPVMEQLAAFERSREQLKAEILTALAYPALVLMAGLGSVGVILGYVVPRFSESFAAAGFAPPLPMRLLLAASTGLRDWWGVILPAGVALAAALALWAGTAAGRLRLDGTVLRMPWIGPAAREADTARFARALATLLGASVPLLEALGIARGVLANRHIDGALAPVAQEVRQGKGLARPVARSGALPALAATMLAIGEETGQLGRMAERLAEIYERKTATTLKRFTAVFEPLVILFLGVIVGSMILSIMAALTSLQGMGL